MKLSLTKAAAVKFIPARNKSGSGAIKEAGACRQRILKEVNVDEGK